MMHFEGKEAVIRRITDIRDAALQKQAAASLAAEAARRQAQEAAVPQTEEPLHTQAELNTPHKPEPQLPDQEERA